VLYAHLLGQTARACAFRRRTTAPLDSLKTWMARSNAWSRPRSSSLSASSSSETPSRDSAP